MFITLNWGQVLSSTDSTFIGQELYSVDDTTIFDLLGTFCTRKPYECPQWNAFDKLWYLHCQDYYIGLWLHNCWKVCEIVCNWSNSRALDSRSLWSWFEPWLQLIFSDHNYTCRWPSKFYLLMNKINAPLKISLFSHFIETFSELYNFFFINAVLFFFLFWFVCLVQVFFFW